MVLLSPRSTFIAWRTTTRPRGRRTSLPRFVVPVLLWLFLLLWTLSRPVSRTATSRTQSPASVLCPTWWRTRVSPVSSRDWLPSCLWPAPSLCSASGWLRLWSPPLARLYKYENDACVIIACYFVPFLFFFFYKIGVLHSVMTALWCDDNDVLTAILFW